MSYILDALRRADAERIRGQVPGLHSHAAAAAPRAVRTSQALRAGLIGLGAGTLLALGALWAWRHGPERAPAGSVTLAAAEPAPTAAIAAPPTPVVAPAPFTAVTPSAGSVVPATPSGVAPPVAGTTSPVSATSPSPLPRTAASTRVEKAGGGVESARTRSVAASSAAPATDMPVAGANGSVVAPGPPKVLRFEELPEDVKRQLPLLAIGGSAYSANPTSRFVIVNGQLLHEGDALAPGLTLEQIRLKSAVLAFRGYRYGISF